MSVRDRETSPAALRCDVVVIGSGIAGLSAALAAAEAGADVIVVERAERGSHGGNTRYTEAFLRMRSLSDVSEDFVEALSDQAGHHIDPALAAETLLDESTWSPLARTLNFTNPTLIARFAEEAGPTLEWLAKQGLRFEPTATPFITTSTTRLAPVGGGLELIETLTRQAELRSVRFEFGVTGESLIRDSTGGVIGLRARRAGGDVIDVAATAVVLACGGFQGNPEMMARYVERASLVRPIARGGYYNRGEGIQMALDAGAAAGGNYSLFHAEPIDPRSGIAEPAVFIFPYGVLVDLNGHRFVDEAPGKVDATYEAITRRILERPRGIAYVILDAGVEDVPNYQVALRTDQPPIRGDSLPQLARTLGIPADTFARTMADYNAACPDPAGFEPLELDGLATSGVEPPKSNWARPVDRSPFLAYPITCANVFSFGGVVVTTSGQVVHRDGWAIPGLYAAGEVIGLYHDVYVGSTSVLRGAVFGRLAGEHAGATCAEARTAHTGTPARR